jgi:hypothetical protein
MKIVISAMCHSAGIAVALKSYFPSWDVKPLPIYPYNDDERNKFCEELKSCDIWVTSSFYELAEKLDIRVLKAPLFQFSGFHPDLCYAKSKKTNELTLHPYNSRIPVWAFNNSINVYQAAKLYNERVYKTGEFNHEVQHGLGIHETPDAVF